MSAAAYVLAAYAVFVGTLAWDFLAPRLQIRQARRRALALARSRAAARSRAGDAASKELIR